MRQHAVFTSSLSLPLLFALAACGSPSGIPTEIGNTNPAPIDVAKSSLTRAPAESVPATSLAAAVTANNAFALDLYSRLRTSTGGAQANLITSPLSASLALTMTSAGAAGTTATQMATALHQGSPGGAIFDGQNALSQALASRAAAALAAAQASASGAGGGAPPSADDFALQVVNSVWGEKTYTWASPFLDILARDYGTGVYKEDFASQSDASRLAINTWVSDQTSNKISNLLPAGTIDGSTRMVLVNAIHLKLPWATPFEVGATQPCTFTRGDGTTVSASFMNQTLQTVDYADDGQAQIVELPLIGGQVVVDIALPHGDLATYEAGLTASSGLLAGPAAMGAVQLSLPKVSFTSAPFSLVSALQGMGMTDAFNPGVADFSGLCAHPGDGSKLYIADVEQKAMLGMSETGVEAAAATAVSVDAAISLGPALMTVNKPFVVSIRDMDSGAVLFLGHIVDPTAAGSP